MHRVVIAGIVLYLAALAATIPELWNHGATRRVVGWAACCRPGPPQVGAVDPAGPAAGVLQVGDRILAVEDTTHFAGKYWPQMRVWAYPPGTTYRVQYERAGAVYDVRLSIASRPDRSSVPLICCYLFIGLTFLSVGVLLGWKRPDLRVARLGWLACELTALMYLDIALMAVTRLGWPEPVMRALLSQIGAWNLVAAWWFVADFPFPVGDTRAWRAVRRTLVVLVAMNSPNGFFFAARILTKYSAWAYLPGWLSSVNSVIYSTSRLAVLIALGAVIVRNYRLHRDPSVRRRIEIVAGSIVIAVGLVSVASVVQAIRPGLGSDLLLLSDLAPLPVPFCFYYAVVQYQVFDIRLVVRRSLQYLLARNVLRVLTLAPVALLVMRVAQNPGAPIGSLLNLAGIALILMAGLCLEFRTRILAAVDRRFFRSSMDRENRLRALLVEIAKLGAFAEVTARVEERLAAIFVPESVGFSPNGAAPAPAGGLSLTIHNPGGSVIGALVLGPKKSEEPYSDSERDLLEAVAAQIGLVRESLLAAEERFQAVLDERNRIARELHDTLSQGFAGISLHLEAARKAMGAAPEHARDSLDEARSLAKQSMQEARASLRDLRESSAASHLETRLLALAARSPEVPKVSVDLAEGIGAMASPDAGWHLARIAEEAVTNAFKHARATRVDVELRPSGSQLVLRVRDDGAGFDPAASGNRGFGLLGMRERMEQLRGSVEILSAPGKGTEVRAIVSCAV
jgi:signal transduction histidine kinase